jgi:hypothetical protein
MLLTIPDALDASQLAEARRVVEAAPAATTANSATVPSGKVIVRPRRSLDFRTKCAGTFSRKL